MIAEDDAFSLQLVVTGMHLSSYFGMTIREIEEDGFSVDRKCDMLLSSDTPLGVTKSMGIALIGLADIFEDLQPDIVLLLGDRFEIFCAASAAFVARIPVAHLHGGEITEGAIDEGLRHSITKMSRLHFVSTEAYRQRVIQLGEEPGTVFNVGSLGVENIRHLRLPSRESLGKQIGFDLGPPYIIATVHPETAGSADTIVGAKALLSALEDMNDLRIIFTGSNADARGREINRFVSDFVASHRERSVFFDSMGRVNYFGAARFAEAVVGNSSSGIIEIPSLKVPTINIGDRQKGRVRAESVIDCPAQKEAIKIGLRKAISDDFSRSLAAVRNPYEKPKTAETICSVIKTLDLSKMKTKTFFEKAAHSAAENGTA
jgi:UDP-hydrolysing UDP-N-acetyl-D-glucosamine 2-epimerase